MCFTGQILCVDHYAPRVDGFTLARDEFLITGGLSMIIALLTEEIRLEGILEAAVPILYAGVLSGAVGYTLQIMCLESVFAVLTGVILLGERMTGREAAGCVLMFTAVILAQLSTAMREKHAQKAEAEAV